MCVCVWTCKAPHFLISFGSIVLTCVPLLIHTHVHAHTHTHTHTYTHTRFKLCRTSQTDRGTFCITRSNGRHFKPLKRWGGYSVCTHIFCCLHTVRAFCERTSYCACVPSACDLWRCTFLSIHVFSAFQSFSTFSCVYTSFVCLSVHTHFSTC